MSLKRDVGQAGADSGGGMEPDCPIDLAHLARQTMDDADLQREVLAIFARQAGTVQQELEAAEGEDRKRIAHKLKGAAQAVGAFAIADCAIRLMDDPTDAEALERIPGLVEAVRRFAADFDA
ncbi:MAG: Hpt domain-containing protein [Rhizobiaceae bacterium]|nr:Hpt domain-containing protein [Rhizobiaceae bacterium]